MRDVALSSQTGHVVIVASDGKVYAWGYNSSGQVTGATNETYVFAPRQVTLPVGFAPTRVGQTAYSSYAIGSDGTTYAWGGAGSGQLGIGSYVSTSPPTLVQAGQMPTGVHPISIDGGGDMAVTLASDGYIYSTGSTSNGQLGTGGTGKVSTWTKIARPTPLLTPAVQTRSARLGTPVASLPLRAVALYGTVSRTATGLPSGWSFDPTTGVVAGTLASREPVKVTVTAVGTRPDEATASATVEFGLAIDTAALSAGGGFTLALRDGSPAPGDGTGKGSWGSGAGRARSPPAPCNGARSLRDPPSRRCRRAPRTRSAWRAARCTRGVETSSAVSATARRRTD